MFTLALCVTGRETEAQRKKGCLLGLSFLLPLCPRDGIWARQEEGSPAFSGRLLILSKVLLGS